MKIALFKRDDNYFKLELTVRKEKQQQQQQQQPGYVSNLSCDSVNFRRIYVSISNLTAYFSENMLFAEMC